MSYYIVPRKGAKTKKFAVKIYLGEGGPINPRTGKPQAEKWVGGGFPTKAAAKEWIRQNLPVFGGKNYGAASDRKLTVERRMLTWLTERRRDGTLRIRTWERYEQFARVHILPTLGHLPLIDVQIPAIKQTLARCEEAGVSPRTRHHVLMLLHKFFTDCVADELIGENKADKVQPPRVPHYGSTILNDEQMLRFMEEAKSSRLTVFWPLLLTTALRLGEGLALRMTDLEGDLLHIRQTVYWPQGGGYRFGPPKSKKSRRTVKLDPEVAALLQGFVQAERKRRGSIDPAALVFVNGEGQPYMPKAARSDFRRLMKRAKLPAEVRIHDLRHSHLSYLARQGIPAVILGARAGHASLASSEAYIHDDGRQDGAVAAVGRLLRKGGGRDA